MAKRYGIVIDLERCIGCHTCTIACKLENNIEKDSAIRVKTIGGPHRDSPAGVYPQLSMHFLPVLCMHCETPSCMEVCPQEAIFKRPDSIVMIDVEKCDGCGVCLSACSYDALLLDEQRDIARKCTLCAHRIDQGLEPFCVTCCSAEAMFFGDLNDADSHISKMIKERQAGFVQPEAKTNPAVYYCPTRFGRIE